MFDQINHQQEKLFNLSKIILISVALIMSITVIYFVFFYKRLEARDSDSHKTRIERADFVIEP